MHAKLMIGAISIAMSASLQPAAAAPDWQMVAKTLGKSGTEMPDGVYRVGLPRTDLKVSLDGVAVKPGFALGGWVAFEPMGNKVMVMGDIVLTQDEVNPVMKKLEESGIEITALHNHLLRAEPMTLYMHVLGQGDPVTLAAALHAGLALSKTPMVNATPAATQPQIAFDTAAVEQAIGRKGKANGGIYQFTIARAETITDGGMTVPASMGSAIGINFQPTGGDKAAITGDFVLIDPVLRALRENGIEVTALHSHMLDEQPRLFFMHFWANDDAVKLARGLKAALDKMNLANS
ncbi:DUF1259 domain-containing protein [Mesorhizobium sp. M0808]|uniref:DUF1259 domain-containing protein n=1 Tax=Mesorhizobium sp. M0808 TaxID=2957002 RepID=UPI003335B543